MSPWSSLQALTARNRELLLSWHDPLQSADGDAQPDGHGFGPEPSFGSGWNQIPTESGRVSAGSREASAGGGWDANQTVSWTSVAGPTTSAAPASDSLAGQESSLDLTSPASPPVLWLGIAALLVAIGIGVFFAGHGATAGVIGWIVAGPLAITALGVFIVLDGKRAETGWYRPSSVADWGRRAVVLLALVAVALNAFLIANDVARGLWR